MEAHPILGVGRALTLPNRRLPQAMRQAEAMEIDEDDAPYLNLHDARERQGYAILKNRSFVHTRAFDPDLLIKIGMYEYFSNVWHAIGWDNFCDTSGVYPLNQSLMCELCVYYCLIAKNLQSKVGVFW